MDSTNQNLIGIIGAGRLGQAMAQTAMRAGRRVVISNSRGPGSLTAVAQALGSDASAGTVVQAAAAPIVVLAVPWPRVPEAIRGLAWNGQVLIDTTNDFDPTDLDGTTSSEVVAGLAAGARVVKAGNTLGAGDLASDPRQAGGRRVIFLSGDDVDAKPRWSRCSRRRVSSPSTSAPLPAAARCSRCEVPWPG